MATPAAVKRAALLAFGVAAAAGLVLAALTTWALLAVGAVAIAAAWGYTGTSKPYGYRGLGELSVFVFFGLVAVVGHRVRPARGASTPSAVVGGVAMGALACAILVANNLRDVPTDAVAGKRTLAVVLGDPRTRRAVRRRCWRSPTSPCCPGLPGRCSRCCPRRWPCRSSAPSPAARPAATSCPSSAAPGGSSSPHAVLLATGLALG